VGDIIKGGRGFEPADLLPSYLPENSLYRIGGVQKSVVDKRFEIEIETREPLAQIQKSVYNSTVLS